MAGWKPGARVHHATFGDGTVLESNDQHITIHFDRVGRKKFAPHIVVFGECASADLASVRSGTAHPVRRDQVNRDDRAPDVRGIYLPPSEDLRRTRRSLGRGGQAEQSPPGPANSISGPSSIEDLIALASDRVDTEASFNSFAAEQRRALT